MGSGQTFLTLMALMLMGRLIIGTNSSLLNTGSGKDMAEYTITATSLGVSVIERAKALAFDAASVDTFITAARINELTPSNQLGPEIGETASAMFNDIDDFNNYARIDTIPNSAIFKTAVKVSYIDVASNEMTPTSSKTFKKMITVYVTSDYLVNYTMNPPTKDTLTFRTVFSYWYFR
jgi:hypothetical protein